MFLNCLLNGVIVVFILSSFVTSFCLSLYSLENFSEFGFWGKLVFTISWIILLAFLSFAIGYVMYSLGYSIIKL